MPGRARDEKHDRLAETTREASVALEADQLLLRGRDSNPNFLIQSQASYH